jgi:hypothetical protein
MRILQIFCLVWPGATTLPISTSWVARIIGVSHCAWLQLFSIHFFRDNIKNIFLIRKSVKFLVSEIASYICILTSYFFFSLALSTELHCPYFSPHSYHIRGGEFWNLPISHSSPQTPSSKPWGSNIRVLDLPGSSSLRESQPIPQWTMSELVQAFLFFMWPPLTLHLPGFFQFPSLYMFIIPLPGTPCTQPF